MKVSFIIPAYNEAAELPSTLTALRRAIDDLQEKSPPPFTASEIVVVDDHSTDETAALARQHGVRVQTVEKRQIAAVRNAGAKVATGDLLVFIDADTRVRATHLYELVQTLEKGAIGGGAPFLFEEPVPPLWRRAMKIFSWLYFGARLGAGCFLFARRDDFEAIGGFDERYFAGEEVYFTWALKKRGRFALIKTPVETSARKLRLFRPWTIIRQLLLFTLGPWVLRHKRWLHFWYGGEREKVGS